MLRFIQFIKDAFKGLFLGLLPPIFAILLFADTPSGGCFSSEFYSYPRSYYVEALKHSKPPTPPIGYTKASLGLDYSWERNDNLSFLSFAEYIYQQKLEDRFPEHTIRQKAWQAHRTQVSRILYNH